MAVRETRELTQEQRVWDIFNTLQDMAVFIHRKTLWPYLRTQTQKKVSSGKQRWNARRLKVFYLLFSIFSFYFF
jgi:hypothetical protein